MPRPSFNNVGLRRDLNLSDLDNKDLALNNLLNDLVTTSDGQTFDKDDLQTAIKGIANTNVTNGSIALMANLTVKNTILDVETNEVVDEIAQPLITVKNQIDSIIATTNDPPFFNGGDGMIASFYEVEQIRPESQLTIASSGSFVVSGTPVVTKPYWTNGLFEFSNKLDDTLGGSNGAVQWNGWYIPDSSGPSTFNFSTTGLIIVEFENEFGDFEIKKNIYKFERNVFATDVDVEGDQVRTSAQQAATIAVNDVLIAVYDDNGDPVALPTDRLITVQSAGTTVITLSESIAETGIGTDWEFIFSNEDLVGTESFSFSIVLPDVVKYIPIRLRITYWYPGVDAQYFNKVLDVNLTTQLKSSGDLPYWYLYTELGDYQLDEGFKGFYDKRLLLGGGTIGPENVLVTSQYNKWQSLNPLVLKYDPPRTYSNALRAIYRYSIRQDSNVIDNTSTSPYTDNLEIGTVLFATGVPEGAFITDISRNNIVVMSELATDDNALDITFMDHRGFLSSSLATSNGFIVTIGSTAGLRVGTVVICEGAPEGDYIRVTKVNTNRQFETNIELGIGTTQKRIYFYSDKGLQNRAYDKFCVGTLGVELAATASNGDTYLTLLDVTGIALNTVIQADPYIPFDPDNSIITRVAEVNPSGYPANTIRITNALAHPDGDDMVAGTTIVIAPSDTTQNKEACVVPLNTAPPFVGTIDGLRTTDGSGGTKDLELANVNGVLKVKKLNIRDTPETTVLVNSTTNPPYNRTLPIKCAGVSYKILGSTS